MKTMVLIVLVGFILAISAACVPERAATSVPTYTPAVRQGATAVVGTSSPKPEWEQNWESTIVEAKKEGSLLVYSGSIGESRSALTAAFKEEFGISVDIVAGRGEEIVAKIQAERVAGILAGDVGLPGMTWYFNSVKPMGITVPIQPLLVLPEVLDLSKWRQGKLPLGDKDGHLAVILIAALPWVAVNSDLVQANEITSISDILEPKWRGKIILNDPSIGGGGAEFFAFTVNQLMGLEKGTAFMKALAKQDPVISRDNRLMAESIARGKYPVGLGPDQAPFTELIKAGAHLSFPKLKEPGPTTSAAGNIFVFDKAPHKNAAKLFVNWLLSKKGATVYSKSFGYPTTRVDVPTEGIDPTLILGPNDVLGDEDFQLAKGQMLKLAKEIFSEQLR